MSGPCFSSSVAVHTSIPANDLCLGVLLSLLLANRRSAPGYLMPLGALDYRRYRTITHPYAFRLACVGPHR